jgi:hypothetical protein
VGVRQKLLFERNFLGVVRFAKMASAGGRKGRPGAIFCSSRKPLIRRDILGVFRSAGTPPVFQSEIEIMIRLYETAAGALDDLNEAFSAWRGLYSAYVLCSEHIYRGILPKTSRLTFERIGDRCRTPASPRDTS